MLKSRRSFLGLLAAAPIAAPAIAKGMTAEVPKCAPGVICESVLDLDTGILWVRSPHSIRWYPGRLDLVEVDPACDFVISTTRCRDVTGEAV